MSLFVAVACHAGRRGLIGSFGAWGAYEVGFLWFLTFNFLFRCDYYWALGWGEIQYPRILSRKETEKGISISISTCPWPSNFFVLAWILDLDDLVLGLWSRVSLPSSTFTSQDDIDLEPIDIQSSWRHLRLSNILLTRDWPSRTKAKI